MWLQLERDGLGERGKKYRGGHKYRAAQGEHEDAVAHVRELRAEGDEEERCGNQQEHDAVDLSV